MLAGPVTPALALCDEAVVAGVLAAVLHAVTRVTRAIGGATSCSQAVSGALAAGGARALSGIAARESSSAAAAAANCTLGGGGGSSGDGGGSSVGGGSGGSSPLFRSLANITVNLVLPYGGLVDEAMTAITSLSQLGGGGGGGDSGGGFEAAAAALANATGCAATSFTFGYVRVTSTACGGGASAENCQPPARAAAPPFAGTPAGIAVIAIGATAALVLAVTAAGVSLTRHVRATAARASLLYFSPAPAPAPASAAALEPRPLAADAAAAAQVAHEAVEKERRVEL